MYFLLFLVGSHAHIANLHNAEVAVLRYYPCEFVRQEHWSKWRGSNPRPRDPKSRALPAELHLVIWKLKGLPTYLGFQALFRVVAPRRGLLRNELRYLVSSPINHCPLVPWATRILPTKRLGFHFRPSWKMV